MMSVLTEPRRFQRRYKLNQKQKAFRINSFEEIGWKDPFPDGTESATPDATPGLDEDEKEAKEDDVGDGEGA